MSVVRTRVVSNVLVRVGKLWLAYTLPCLIKFRSAAWRQGRLRDGATNQDSWRNHNDPSTRVPFRRTAGDFIISFVCLGLPYLFLERSHHQRFNTESGVRSNADPMLVVGARACWIVSWGLQNKCHYIDFALSGHHYSECLGYAHYPTRHGRHFSRRRVTCHPSLCV